MDNEKMIESIRALCKSKNITPTKLEEELGFSQGLVSRWKDKNPNIDRIIDIADYFHVSIDEVVGHNNIVNDKFLGKLISQTEERTIHWNVYDNKNENQPKQYFGLDIGNYDFLDQDDINAFFESHKERSYYCKIKDVYISIYANYNYNEILSPQEIKLFIQSSLESKLIEQNYSYDQLKVLWLKVLYTLGANAPDEIKAEEFKYNFINKSKISIDSYTDEQLKQITKNMIEMEPQLPKLFEAITNPEFKALIDSLKSPKLQQGLELAQRLGVYYSMIAHDAGHNIKKTP